MTCLIGLVGAPYLQIANKSLSFYLTDNLLMAKFDSSIFLKVRIAGVTLMKLIVSQI